LDEVEKDMMNKSAEEQPGVPPQNEGTQKDIVHTVRTDGDEDARKLFMIARNRLMDVNHWEEYSKPVTATFALTDVNGKEQMRTAEKGDYFKIDLPGPGSAEGKGYDWVKIEAIEEQGHPDRDMERIVIRVRPAPAPGNDRENIAHFFDERATSSFVVERNGSEVRAAVFGRNEVPNVGTSNVIDKVRNAMVGTGAILGLANVQWKNLVKGLVETKG
jgi:hypothetical protein